AVYSTRYCPGGYRPDVCRYSSIFLLRGNQSPSWPLYSDGCHYRPETQHVAYSYIQTQTAIKGICSAYSAPFAEIDCHTMYNPIATFAPTVEYRSSGYIRHNGLPVYRIQ